MFLVFDTETTGLPKRWNAPISDHENWPRCVQIAWQLHDDFGTVSNTKIILFPQKALISHLSQNKYTGLAQR